MINGRNYRIAILAAMIIGAVLGSFAIQSGTDGIYDNALLVPTDANTIYAQKIKSDIAAAAIRVSKMETADRLPERYQLTVNLSNRSKTQYEYKVTLNGYPDSLICDTSNTEITYEENYSTGKHSNAKTVYYFVPAHKRSETANAGELSFDSQRNDPTSHVGVAEIEIAGYSPYTPESFDDYAAAMF